MKLVQEIMKILADSTKQLEDISKNGNVIEETKYWTTEKLKVAAAEGEKVRERIAAADDGTEEARISLEFVDAMLKCLKAELWWRETIEMELLQ
jgi:hypothetical protein